MANNNNKKSSKSSKETHMSHLRFFGGVGRGLENMTSDHF